MDETDHDQLERLVQLVRDSGYSTGHADNAEMLVRELLEQFEGVRRERDVFYARLKVWSQHSGVGYAQYYDIGRMARDLLEEARKAREGVE